MTTKNFLVSASHVCPKYEVDGQIEARHDRGFDQWYVSQHPFGCSKNYRSPEEAIRGLLIDNGCFNINIEPLEV